MELFGKAIFVLDARAAGPDGLRQIKYLACALGEEFSKSRGVSAMIGSMEPDARKRQIMIWYALAAMIGMLAFQYFLLSYTQIETIPYSEFERLLKDGKVAEVTVSADAIQGTLKEPLSSGKRVFYAVRVDPQLADKLAAQNVVVKGTPSGGLVQIILSWVVPAIIFYLVWMFIFRRVAEKQGVGGLMTIGKSRAKVYVETDTKVTFKDVAGVEEAKFELEYLHFRI
jgi:cell division protease FtsH